MRNRLATTLAMVLALLGSQAATAVAVDSSSGMVAGAEAACSETVTAWGYTGAKMCGTTVVQARWVDDVEYFVVSPGRTVWHAWRGSGGWQRVSNGRADNMGGWGLDASGRRMVIALVNGSGNWCSSLQPSHGWTTWYPCLR